MLSSTLTRNHRRIDLRPGPYVLGRNFVSRSSETALATKKIVSGFSVRLVDIPATRALLGSIARIDEDYRDAFALRLIRKKTAKLEEPPVGQSSTPVLSGRYPISDAAQVFKGDSRVGAFSILNDLLADTVINVFLKSRLLAGNLFKFASGRGRLFALQVTPPVLESHGGPVDSFTAVVLPVGVGGQVNNSHVNAQHVRGLNQLRVVEITDSGKVKFAVNPHQVHFAFAKGKELALVVAHNEGNLLAARCSPDRNSIVLGEPDDVMIVGLCGIPTKAAHDFTVKLIGIGHFGNTAYHHIRRKIELLFGLTVGQFMQVILAKNFRVPTAFGKIITGSIRFLKRGLENSGLVLCRLEFKIHYELHRVKYRRLNLVCQGGRAFSPWQANGVPGAEK